LDWPFDAWLADSFRLRPTLLHELATVAFLAALVFT